MLTEIYTVQIVSATGTLSDRLRLMFDWYKGMVGENTDRLLYIYDPQSDVRIGDGEPIRDIAAIWDIEVLGAFLQRDDFRPVIRCSLNHFDQFIIDRDGCAIIASHGEPSSIAHSAFPGLALIHSESLDMQSSGMLTL